MVAQQLQPSCIVQLFRLPFFQSFSLVWNLGISNLVVDTVRNICKLEENRTEVAFKKKFKKIQDFCQDKE